MYFLLANHKLAQKFQDDLLIFLDAVDSANQDGQSAPPRVDVISSNSLGAQLLKKLVREILLYLKKIRIEIKILSTQIFIYEPRNVGDQHYGGRGCRPCS